MWSCEFQPKDVPGWTCCSCISIYIWVNLPEDLLDDQVEDVKSPSMMTVVELVMSQVYRIEGQGTFQNPGAQNSPCGDCSQEDHGWVCHGDNDLKNLSILIFNLLKIYFNRHPSAWKQKLKDVAKAFTSVRHWRAMPNAPLQWAAWHSFYTFCQ